MIQCIQQVGNTLGKRQVFAFDKVYKVEGDARLYLGLVGHGEGVKFQPRIALTDNEVEEVTAAINRHRAKFGRKPIAGIAGLAPTIAQAAAAIEAANTGNEVDDE